MQNSPGHRLWWMALLWSIGKKTLAPHGLENFSIDTCSLSEWNGAMLRPCRRLIGYSMQYMQTVQVGCALGRWQS